MAMTAEDITITTSGSFRVVFTTTYDITSLSYYAQIRNMQGDLICNLHTSKIDAYNLVLSLSRTEVDQYFIPSSGEEWIWKYQWSLKEVHTAVTDERYLIEQAYVNIKQGGTDTP